jgi:hypothetical protein
MIVWLTNTDGVTHLRHIFHTDCLVPWLETNGTCPVWCVLISPLNHVPDTDADTLLPRHPVASPLSPKTNANNIARTSQPVSVTQVTISRQRRKTFQTHSRQLSTASLISSVVLETPRIRPRPIRLRLLGKTLKQGRWKVLRTFPATSRQIQPIHQAPGVQTLLLLRDQQNHLPLLRSLPSFPQPPISQLPRGCPLLSASPHQSLRARRPFSLIDPIRLPTSMARHAPFTPLVLHLPTTLCRMCSLVQSYR